MRLVAVEFLTLDGVMEAPGFEEHRSGLNGWATRVSDAELQDFSGEQVRSAGALLFGRTTFVTRTVRDLVTGAEAGFTSRGSVKLRGVPGEWELFTATLR